MSLGWDRGCVGFGWSEPQLELPTRYLSRAGLAPWTGWVDGVPSGRNRGVAAFGWSESQLESPIPLLQVFTQYMLHG